MADIVEKLQLEQKPVPRKRKGVAIKLGSDRGGPRISVINRLEEGYDRDALRRRLKELQVTMGEIVPTKTGAPPTPAALPVVKMAAPPSRVVVPKKKKVTVKAKGKAKAKKIKGRIRIGSIYKGTITGIEDVPRKPVRARLLKGIKLKSAATARKFTDVEARLTRVGEKTIAEHLRPPEPAVRVLASAYYRNNREIFVNFIDTLFQRYRTALEELPSTISCEKGSGPFRLLTHQEIVRDYMNLFTPYRGLLLYHGLGAGKTCASIAIAEGLRTSSSKKVFILTPASLRQNYINELKICGNPLFRANQFWEFVSTTQRPELAEAFAKVLKIPLSFINKQKGAWFVDLSKPPNYDTLGIEHKVALNEQIDLMISAKYQFLNYNGWTQAHLDRIARNGNPFDDRVVIIDEAHNFVGRIANKLSKPQSLSYRVYEYMLSAQRCRFVFLTGTPLINYPNEIAVLFNMLRGYIIQFSLTVNIQTAKKINQKSIETILRGLKRQLYDYVEYSPSSKTIIITRNPFGFVSKYNKALYEGIALEAQGAQKTTSKGTTVVPKVPALLDDRAFISEIKKILAANGIKVIGDSSKSFKALPDNLKDFTAQFIDSRTGEIKNENLLQRRILGLTSYFKSPREELMPSFDPDQDFYVVDVPMSDYQFSIYEKAREGERAMELRNARKRKRAGGQGDQEDTVSTYRIFSRAFCNFVFPQDIGRPLPQQGQDIVGAAKTSGIEEDALDIVSVDEQLANVDGRFDQSDAEVLAKLASARKTSGYDKRIRQALVALTKKAGDYLSPAGLETYSPKFLSILETIQTKAGLHLVYSQFRTLEGIGIFSMVLEQNGFAQFRIIKSPATGKWTIDTAPADVGKPCFALYTGTEKREEKEIIRNIYNSNWDKIPLQLAEELRARASNNDHGEIIRVFMITSSGAEGITLKNTRFVHIMEPYWHPARIEQVIGRARRICSHNSLPADEQNITVYIYLMVFTEAQLVPAEAGGMASNALLQKDTSKIERGVPYTSDQALFEISNTKKDINNQILRIVKSSAMDCGLHARAEDKEPIICLSFGNVPPNRFTTAPALTTEPEHDRQRRLNLKKITWKAEVVTIRQKRYALKRFKPRLSAAKAPEGELYDYESYLRARTPRWSSYL